MYGLLAKRVYRIAFELRVSEYQNRQSIKHSIALDNYINIDIVDRLLHTHLHNIHNYSYNYNYNYDKNTIRIRFIINDTLIKASSLWVLHLSFLCVL